MAESEYSQIFKTQMAKYQALKAQRDAIKDEMRRVLQLIRATIAMLPEDECAACISEYAVLRQNEQENQQGLTESIRHVLFYLRNRGWMTPVEIKEALEKNGFSFEDYKSNPLISVHSVLKRFKKTEVKSSRMMDGSTRYRLTPKAIKERELREKYLSHADAVELVRKQTAGEFTEDDIPF